jgi:hypothetical protein
MSMMHEDMHQEACPYWQPHQRTEQVRTMRDPEVSAGDRQNSDESETGRRGQESGFRTCNSVRVIVGLHPGFPPRQEIPALRLATPDAAPRY